MEEMKLYSLILLSLIGISACQTDAVTIENPKNESLFHDKIALASLEDSRIDEASGLAESLQYPGHFWIHNDSGDEPRLFLVNTQGKTIVTLALQGIQNRDWEDIATGPGDEPNESYIYVGEIGDNNAQYTYKNIYRLKEPVLNNLNKGQFIVSDAVETITFNYQDGSRDAETVMVDPQTNDIYIVSKREDQVQVYLLEYPQSLTDTLVLPVIKTLPFTRITAGDISANGLEIVIKTHTAIYYWKRNDSESISEALTQKAKLLPYYKEPQGEAIAWLKDGSGYMTVSEKSENDIVPVLYLYKRK